MPALDEMPSTIKRSPRLAREIWSQSHDSAVETYGDGEIAHRLAFAALKRAYRKEGDRWVRRADKPMFAVSGIVAPSRLLTAARRRERNHV